MAAAAQITAVESLEAFRASLIVYLSQVRPLLDEVGNEVSRTRLWLQNDQRQFWDHERRLRERRMEEAKQELFNARLSQFHESIALYQMNFQRAQRAVQEAEARLAQLKKWDRELDHRAAPLLKQTEQLQGFLASDMVRAVTYLDQALKALDAYRQVAAPPGSRSVAAAGPADGEAKA
ncbi:MAG: hypothetical protein WCS94_00835 [Verrucomicrobiota bacterium]